MGLRAAWPSLAALIRHYEDIRPFHIPSRIIRSYRGISSIEIPFIRLDNPFISCKCSY
jgi:hypothetical protein